MPINEICPGVKFKFYGRELALRVFEFPDGSKFSTQHKTFCALVDDAIFTFLSIFYLN